MQCSHYFWRSHFYGPRPVATTRPALWDCVRMGCFFNESLLSIFLGYLFRVRILCLSIHQTNNVLSNYDCTYMFQALMFELFCTRSNIIGWCFDCICYESVSLIFILIFYQELSRHQTCFESQWMALAYTGQPKKRRTSRSIMHNILQDVLTLFGPPCMDIKIWLFSFTDYKHCNRSSRLRDASHASHALRSPCRGLVLAPEL